MTSPNTLIADLAHEIDRLRNINQFLFAVAVRSELFISGFEDDKEQEGIAELLIDLRAAIVEAS